MIYFILWYLVGFISIILFHLRDEDLTVKALIQILGVSFLGVLVFIAVIGVLINEKGDKVLIKKFKK